MIDILHATPGSDTDCMNSRCIKAQRNAHIFPHPVYAVSTIRSRVYIVDALDDAGEPAHVIRYELSKAERAKIDAHDIHGVAEPGTLRLRRPKDPKGSPNRRAYPGRYADVNDGKRAKGDGKRTRDMRPVTAVHGAQARVVAAVGMPEGV